MLKHRLITGPLLVALLIALIVLDDWVDTVQLRGVWSELFLGREHPPHGLVMFGLGLLVAAVGGVELSRIVSANNIMSRPWLMSVAATVGLALCYSIPMGTDAITAVAIVSTGLVLVFVASLLTFAQHRNVEGVVAAAGAVMFAMVYLGLMIGFLLALRREHSAWWIVGILLTTKACDTGAYFTGRALGRHKMIPWLSPGKTWEGLAGGVAFAALVGGLLALASLSWLQTSDHVPIWLGVMCGVVFAIVGQFGDLTMSLLKRGAGLKDSSRVLPGLGGVLDVIDSPLMVAPVAFWIFELAV